MTEFIRYYDRLNKRLVYIGIVADESFWDAAWSPYGVEKVLQFRRDPFTMMLVQQLKKYLPVGARVLEGGCGCGDKVYAFKATGYDAYGVDFAEETIKKVKNNFPELNVEHGDVRKLRFEDNFFDGYLSLGVIEHYYYGYDDIVAEIHRVLRRGGILFMTVPTMSCIRKWKAMLGVYPRYAESEEMIQRFYQFALDPGEVIKRFESKGFRSLEMRNTDGFYGLNVEIDFFKPIFQSLYREETVLREMLIRMFESFGNMYANHLTLYIMEKM